MESEIFMEPPNIYLKSDAYDIDFNPKADCLVVSLANRSLELYTYSPKETILTFSANIENGPLRISRFSPCGTKLLCGGANLHIFDGETLSVVGQRSCPSHIYTSAFLSTNIAALSLDNGELEVLDLRSFDIVYRAEIETAKEGDYVFSQLLGSTDRSLLFAPASNGNLYTFDLRKHGSARDKLFARTSGYDEELTSVAPLGDEKQLVCGTSAGHLQLYKWGLFGHFSDAARAPGGEVICLARIDGDTLATASEDGCVRLWNFYPHCVATLEPHAEEDEERLPVERIAVSRCARLIASISHDRAVKFYDLTEPKTFESAASTKTESDKGTRAVAQERNFFNDLD